MQRFHFGTCDFKNFKLQGGERGGGGTAEIDGIRKEIRMRARWKERQRGEGFDRQILMVVQMCFLSSPARARDLF